MKFGSVCSGIEAASVAFGPLGWEAQWFSEIEPFPCAVLAHHYPRVPNLGDMTKIYGKPEFKQRPIDLLCGGTPCQSFSVAGLRKGLDDPRGNLALEFLRIAEVKRPRWVLWENVPGVLSSGGGRDFGSFLGALGQLGYGWAYRVLDARFFGVPQRRKRVFVVAYLGDWRAPAAVLFERESLCRDFKTGYEQRKNVARHSKSCTAEHDRQPDVVFRKSRRAQSREDCETWVDDGVANTLNAFDIGERDTHAVVTVPCFWDGTQTTQTTQTLDAVLYKGQTLPEKNRFPAIIEQRVYENHGQDSRVKEVEISPQLNAKAGTGGGNLPLVVNESELRVRRLTPTECERLQGFPDGYTNLAGYRGRAECPDSPRYKALGNSWAVPCARWIGERIQAVDDRLLLGSVL